MDASKMPAQPFTSAPAQPGPRDAPAGAVQLPIPALVFLPTPMPAPGTLKPAGAGVGRPGTAVPRQPTPQTGISAALLAPLDALTHTLQRIVVPPLQTPASEALPQVASTAGPGGPVPNTNTNTGAAPPPSSAVLPPRPDQAAAAAAAAVSGREDGSLGPGDSAAARPSQDEESLDGGGQYQPVEAGRRGRGLGQRLHSAQPSGSGVFKSKYRCSTGGCSLLLLDAFLLVGIERGWNCGLGGQCWRWALWVGWGRGALWLPDHPRPHPQN
jgi:hypothetical protein